MQKLFHLFNHGGYQEKGAEGPELGVLSLSIFHLFNHEGTNRKAERAGLGDYSIRVIFFNLREQTYSLKFPADYAYLRRAIPLSILQLPFFNHGGHKEKGAEGTELGVLSLSIFHLFNHEGTNRKAQRAKLGDYSIRVIFFNLREQTYSLKFPADYAYLRRSYSIIHFTFSIFLPARPIKETAYTYSNLPYRYQKPVLNVC